MFTVYLAFVVFTEAGVTPPRIIEAYNSLDECFIAATQKNRDTLNQPAKPGQGYVCLQMRAPV